MHNVSSIDIPPYLLYSTLSCTGCAVLRDCRPPCGIRTTSPSPCSLSLPVLDPQYFPSWYLSTLSRLLCIFHYCLCLTWLPHYFFSSCLAHLVQSRQVLLATQLPSVLGSVLIGKADSLLPSVVTLGQGLHRLRICHMQDTPIKESSCQVVSP